MPPFRPPPVASAAERLHRFGHSGTFTPVVTAAFKEWAIVVDALGRGEQIFILRKGGIHEGRGGFSVEHPEFLLFPTLFHQQRESVIPSARARFDQIAPSFPPEGTLRFDFWARVVEWQQIDSLETLARLRGQHIWRDEILQERFEWGRSHSIFAIITRIFRLKHPVEIPNSPAYGGCKSWINLAQEIDTSGSTPQLTDSEFQSKLEQFRNALLQSTHR